MTAMSQIQQDGALDVTRDDHVRAENVAINHGIFRDFPTRYRGRNGAQVRVGFALRERHTGRAAGGGGTEYASQRHQDQDRRRGNECVAGEHRYVIRYPTTRQLGRFERL